MRKLCCQIVMIMASISIFGCMGMHPHYPKSQGQIYCEAAREAAINQDYALAEKNWLLEQKEEEKIESADNQDKDELSKIYIIQGRYDEAAKVSSSHWGNLHLAQGKYDEALNIYEKGAKHAEERARHAPSGYGFHVITQAYPMWGRYFIAIGEYEKAQHYLKQEVDFRAKKHDQAQSLAKAKNQLAFACYHAGDYSAAEILFREAAGLNSNAFVKFPDDLAISLTMLGRIAEYHNEDDKALKFYHSAIDNLLEGKTKDFPGAYRVEQADVLNKIGQFHLRHNKLEESAQAFHDAIALRQATATATHPNCADAIKGLADVSVARGELTSATLQATEALKILDASVVPTHPRIAPELVALASIHILSSQPEQAAPLNARLDTILQKPLGPWKEDFLETTTFYAGLLKKARKTEQALKLERIQPKK